MEKKKMNIREKVKRMIIDISPAVLKKYYIRQHTDILDNQLVVSTNGFIHEIKDCKFQKQQGFLLQISEGVSCCCNICKMFRDFETQGKEYFIKTRGIECYVFCENSTPKDALSLEPFFAKDMITEMLINLKTIPYGYFDDEF